MNDIERKLPEDLLGVLIDSEGFVCVDDIKDDEDIDDESKVTPIFNYDDWFTSDECVCCKKIVERV